MIILPAAEFSLVFVFPRKVDIFFFNLLTFLASPYHFSCTENAGRGEARWKESSLCVAIFPAVDLLSTNEREG